MAVSNSKRSISDNAYDQSTWDGDLNAPSKNAMRDIIEQKVSIPSGDQNQWLYLNPAGEITALPHWYRDASNSGYRYYGDIEPNDRGYQGLNQNIINCRPLGNSPTETIVISDASINFDPDSLGFDIGTSGAAVRFVNNTAFHGGTGDLGEINFFQNYFNVGNGTDPISVKGVSYSYGFGEFNSGVTINGNVQGYGFQPTADLGATVDTSACNITAFYDFSNWNCTIGNYTSIGLGPNIDTIANGFGFSSIMINPSIDSFLGSSGFIGFGLYPNLGTFSTGAFKGIEVQPNIDSINGAYGVRIDMSNVTGTNIKALEITGDVTIDGDLSFTGALSIGQLSAYYQVSPVDGGGNPATVHGLISSINALANTTVANCDTIGVNTAMLMEIHANSINTSGPLGLGFAALALPCVVSMETGSTVDNMSAAVYAINLDGAATGGTIDRLRLCRTVAIPNGITTINKMQALTLDLPFGDPATETWGVYIEPSSAFNWLKASLKIGGTAGSTDKAQTGYALEVEGGKFGLASDVDVGFYGTSPIAQPTSSGVATAGGTYGATEQTMLQEVYNAARALGLMS